MRILLINKFLYPRGGAETYVLRLGEYLTSCGHEVQYFGMAHEGNCVGNAAGVYTREMDFRGALSLDKLTYPVRTIYSGEARRKLRLVLASFQPEVVHINNFNYQLTPAILVELRQWRKAGHSCRIIFTAHDYQLLCPNHMCMNPNTGALCEKCFSGHYRNCVRGRCIHGSRVKSLIGAAEATLWKHFDVYSEIDTVICCSGFLKEKMDTNPRFAEKTVVLHNFSDSVEYKATEKKDYVLYFGRYSAEKGIKTLLTVCRELPEVTFVFAGEGPLQSEVDAVRNVKNVGFQSGGELERLVREARFSVCPSEWYENCPFSVIESLLYGTPVLGADIGGIPELIKAGETGELFESGNAAQMKEKIQTLWSDRELTARYSENCRNIRFDTVESYTDKLMEYYQSV